MRGILSCILLLFSQLIVSQTTNTISTLTSQINESSGLIYLNNTFITHNDSDNAPNLYEFNSATGDITRTVHIANAQNKDWEDLAIDETFIYIADFGNNQGNRTDLKIYRISIADYTTTPNDTVYADSILYSYSDQTDFTSSTFSTKYDAEALIAFRDSLFIFTKDWSNSTTRIYSIPKAPGNYSGVKQDSINTGFLVTGADFDTINQKIALIGYSFNSATVLEISNITSKISEATLSPFALNCSESYQVEGVAYANNNCLHISAEQHSSGAAALYELCTPNVGLIEEYENEPRIYPNPATDLLNIFLGNEEYYEIYSSIGQLLYVGKKKQLDLDSFLQGVYTIRILTTNQQKQKTLKFIKL